MKNRLRVWIAGAVVAFAGLGAAWGAYRVTSAPPQADLRFAQSMPKGALVYLEARDLSGLLKTWVASPTRARYYESASYRSFTRSKLYLKFQERLGDLQKGFGTEITEEKLADLAGGPSAIAIYDPGKLEILMATETTRERAMMTALFAGAKNFEQRKTAKGATYYAREVVTDGGNLTQRIAFGYADNRLWIGTSETLLAEALDGPAGGGLSPAVTETARAAGDFAGHDMVIWVDVDRSVRNKYFNLYWIQRNGKELADLATGIIDVQFAADGVHERRWFVRKDGAPAPGGADAGALAKLGALAPANAQLVEAKAADAFVAPALAEAVFGPERGGSTPSVVGFVKPDDPFEASNASDRGEDEEKPVGGRYRYLDERFDKDVDDPAAAVPAKPAVQTTAPKATFADQMASVLGAASPVRYATYGGVRLPEGKLFADFDSAVVVELGTPEKFDAAAFEALVRGEFGRRFVVGGSVEQVAWTEQSGSRAIAGALIPQGGAYRVAGRYLVVARDAATCAEIAGKAGAAGGDVAVKGQVTRVAEVRVAAARGPFARLTKILDVGSSGTVNEEVGDGEGEAPSRPVMFFSENVASLLDVVRDLSRVRIVTAVDGQILREQVDYLYS